MQILIHSTVHYYNMGDVAMLQVCVRRLSAMWPPARLLVITSDPAGLQAYCPGTEPVFSDAPGFADVVRTSNLLVLTGMGAITNSFEADAVNLLDTIRLAKDSGVPAVAFGQGLGPIDASSALWQAAARSLPRLDFIAVREGRRGPEILRQLGMAPDRIAVTGDDAIEIAYRPDATPEVRIGAGIRVARYSGARDDFTGTLAGSLRAIARELGAVLAPVAISYVPGEEDLQTFAEMFPEMASDPADALSVTPEHAVRQAGRCRVVVAGCYHAAVFALSQGIPAICLARSDYYRDKFLGLAGQFGRGCEVLDVSSEFDEMQFADRVRELWRTAGDLRPALLAAAVRQIELSRGAYAAIAQFVPPGDRGGSGLHAYSPVWIAGWWRRRMYNAAIELGKVTRYLAKVEEARDWHRGQAEGAKKQLSEVQAYLAKVEAARDWQRDRADRLEKELQAKGTRR